MDRAHNYSPLPRTFERNKDGNRDVRVGYREVVMRNQTEIPQHLHARYGVRKRRTAPILIGILIAAVVSAGLAFANFRQQNPSISAQLLAFEVTSPSQVLVTWEVSRGPQLDTYCVLRAQDIRRTDVGYATVRIAAGTDYEQLTYALATNGEAVLAQVLGCANSAQMRVPPPDFPPGVKIPEQVAPGVATSS